MCNHNISRNRGKNDIKTRNTFKIYTTPDVRIEVRDEKENNFLNRFSFAVLREVVCTG